MTKINMIEYQRRRKELMKSVGPAGIVIVPSGKEVLRNGDAVYSYRQHSDFYYLTGFPEPDAVLVLAPKRKEGEFILFNRVRDPENEIWDGPRAGLEGACTDFLADQAFPISELENILPGMLSDRETIHYPIGRTLSFDKVLMKCVNKIRAKIRNGLKSPTTFIDINPSLHEMRLLKSDAEIAMMQKAVDITASGHKRAMKACHPGMYEYELEAEIMYEFQRQGARFPAYGTIVGAGKNTCTLHYVSNNQKIADGDLVLIDAGAEYENYAADITRTFPANGRFTSEQRAIYEIVLEAECKAIAAVKPGASWDDPQRIIVKIITQGLLDLGILKGNVDELIEKNAYLPFYMHRSGHWLGLDVHDVGLYRTNNHWRKLEAGMALTVEPGIYISASHKNVHKRWHNIGVRIEDDVVVTKKGVLILSEQVPKTIADIETLMRG
jgi:Xaa-Pro aminopeptidase